MTDDWGISCEIAISWMSLSLTDDKSPLVQVMAWCRQATSHYLSQCWPRFMSPNGITRPHWVKWNWLDWAHHLQPELDGNHSTNLQFYIDHFRDWTNWQPCCRQYFQLLFIKNKFTSSGHKQTGGIYPHTASQYHAQSKAKCGIAILRNSFYPIQKCFPNSKHPLFYSTIYTWL